MKLREVHKGWALWIDDMRDPSDFLKFRMKDYHGFTYREMYFPDFEVYVSHGWAAPDFKWAKSASEAIALVNEFGVPSFMALDHDLGTHDVFQFLHWLSKEHIQFPPEWHAHSANPSGVKNINAFMESWHKQWGHRASE